MGTQKGSYRNRSVDAAKAVSFVFFFRNGQHFLYKRAKKSLTGLARVGFAKLVPLVVAKFDDIEPDRQEVCPINRQNLLLRRPPLSKRFPGAVSQMNM